MESEISEKLRIEEGANNGLLEYFFSLIAVQSHPDTGAPRYPQFCA